MIFLDTGALIARFLKRDQYHDRALKTWERVLSDNTGCVTSNFVLDETLTLFGRWAGNDFAAEKGRNIYSSSLISVVRPDENDELTALKSFIKYSDQSVSFTDCISFILMKKLKITQVFTFDQHFERAGFTIYI